MEREREREGERGGGEEERRGEEGRGGEERRGERGMCHVDDCRSQSSPPRVLMDLHVSNDVEGWWWCRNRYRYFAYPFVARMPVYMFHVDSQIYYFGILHGDRSSQFYTTGLTKTVVCAIACLVWCI